MNNNEKKKHLARTLKQILGKHVDTPVAGSLFGDMADKMDDSNKYHKFFVGFIDKGKKVSKAPPKKEGGEPSLFVGFITKGRKKRQEPSSSGSPDESKETKHPSMLLGLRNLKGKEKKK